MTPSSTLWLGVLGTLAVLGLLVEVTAEMIVRSGTREQAMTDADDVRDLRGNGSG